MGNKIGDYIHYHAINYLKYGINHVGQTSGASAQVSMDTQKRKIQESIRNTQRMSKVDKKELQRRLKWLMSPPYENGGVYSDSESAQEYNELWNLLLEFFEFEFGDAVGRISRSTANIFEGMQVQDLNKINVKYNKQDVMASTILKNLQAIVQAYQNQFSMINGKKYYYSDAEMEILHNTLGEISQALEQLGSEVQGKMAALVAGERSDFKIDLQSAKDVIQAINKIAIRSRGTANLAKGTLFEYMIAVAPLIGKKLTTDALREAVATSLGVGGSYAGSSSGSVKGYQSTAVQFDAKLFSDSANWDQILTQGYVQKNDLIWEARKPSQDKVDVTIQMRPDGKNFNISAKNVNLTGANSRGITLVSNTSLLQLLSHLDSDFATHYLNQHVLRVNSHVQVRPDMYTEAKTIMNLSLLEQALRGFKNGAEKADVFVVNDNITGEIQVLNMGDILSDFINAGELISNFVVEPDVNSLMFPMEWAQGSYSERITRILAAVHSNKITMHMWI